MKIKLICVGKLKERYFIDAERDYLAQMPGGYSVTVTEIPEGGSPNPAEREGEAVLRLIGEGDYVVCADVSGRQFTSGGFFELLLKKNPVCTAIIIGGPYGLSQKVKNRADILLSFSNLTFTHRLARLVVLDMLRQNPLKRGTN
jgi:23S rRNA (pseudouridine1915-N3)-methyltransferase